MTTFGHKHYVVDVATAYAGGKHVETDVDVHIVGPRGGRQTVTPPSSTDALFQFAEDMRAIALRALEAEQAELARARESGALA